MSQRKENTMEGNKRSGRAIVTRAREWLAGAARDAKSAEDHAAIVAEIERQLDEAREQLQELEADRESVVFSGKSLDEHARRIYEAEQRGKTLRAALDGANQRHAAAIEKERTEAIEKSAAEGMALEPEAIAAWHHLFDAMLGVHTAIAALADIDARYGEGVYPAVRAGRKDLYLRGAMRGAWRMKAAEGLKALEPASGNNGLLRSDDAIRITAVAVVQELLAAAVHRDSSDAARNFILASVTGMRTNEGLVDVVPVTPGGRQHGKLGAAPEMPRYVMNASLAERGDAADQAGRREYRAKTGI